MATFVSLAASRPARAGRCSSKDGICFRNKHWRQRNELDRTLSSSDLVQSYSTCPGKGEPLSSNVRRVLASARYQRKCLGFVFGLCLLQSDTSVVFTLGEAWQQDNHSLHTSFNFRGMIFSYEHMSSRCDAFSFQHISSRCDVDRWAFATCLFRETLGLRARFETPFSHALWTAFTTWAGRN